MNFEFATAGKIIFGRETSRQIPEIWKSIGSKPLFVIGNSLGRSAFLSEMIDPHETLIVSGEPTTHFIQESLARVRHSGCDVIIGIGGGSVVDAGKALAALASNTGSLFDYLEVIGAGQPLETAPYPFIAVPTTAGTGSEVTKNAVIASPEHRVKVSLRDNRMIPDVAIVDPVLTYSLPPTLTAYTGMDAFIQCLEPYVSHAANPLTDLICLEGIRRTSSALLRAFHNGEDADAREDMALASLFGGFALANSKLGAVHGFAGPIGGMYAAPHGAVCAALLAPVVEINLRALSQRDPENPGLSKYAQVASILTGNPDSIPSDLIKLLDGMVKELKIPRLAQLGIQKAEFQMIAEKAEHASSMKGNPLKLKRAELLEILERAY